MDAWIPFPCTGAIFDTKDYAFENVSNIGNIDPDVPIAPILTRPLTLSLKNVKSIGVWGATYCLG